MLRLCENSQSKARTVKMQTSHGVIVFNSILFGRSAEGVAFSSVRSPYGREMESKEVNKTSKRDEPSSQTGLDFLGFGAKYENTRQTKNVL